MQSEALTTTDVRQFGHWFRFVARIPCPQLRSARYPVGVDGLDHWFHDEFNEQRYARSPSDS